jgi:hypothetical protein
MDFLDVQLDDMELVQRGNVTCDFPAVTFSKHDRSFVARFNKHASKALDGCKYVKIYANAEYIVFSPISKKDIRSFVVNYSVTHSASICCIGLERFRLEDKVFKLYKTEKGFALKVNDPCCVRKEKNRWESLF